MRRSFKFQVRIGEKKKKTVKSDQFLVAANIVPRPITSPD